MCAELRFGQRSGLSETGRRPIEDIQKDVEFRIMPSGDGGWYWEVIADARKGHQPWAGYSQSAASQEASAAAW